MVGIFKYENGLHFKATSENEVTAIYALYKRYKKSFNENYGNVNKFYKIKYWTGTYVIKNIEQW